MIDEVERIQRELTALSNHEDGQFLQRFFKTGPGEYGAGDRFRGIRAPVLRKLSLANRELPLAQTECLLQSPFHEDRLLALMILVLKFARGDQTERVRIYDLYLRSTRFINNWDLVDSSAEHIVGAHLWGRSEEPLDRLARSSCIWERRIAMLATFHFSKRGSFAATIRIARALLDDREDLIQKAAGWMLREVGKRDLAAEEAFLKEHLSRMPRTMLRYAIEKFPEGKRLGYLKGVIPP